MEIELDDEEDISLEELAKRGRELALQRWPITTAYVDRADEMNGGKYLTEDLLLLARRLEEVIHDLRKWEEIEAEAGDGAVWRGIRLDIPAAYTETCNQTGFGPDEWAELLALTPKPALR